MIDEKKCMRDRALWYVVLMATIIMIDRFTKYWAYRYCDALVINRGMAWGVGHHASSVPFILITLCIIAIVGYMSWYTYRRMGTYPVIGECMVIAGALSNVIDRFVYAGVVDFIAVSCAGWNFPVFNIADSAIVIGVLIMLWTHRDS